MWCAYFFWSVWNECFRYGASVSRRVNDIIEHEFQKNIVLKQCFDYLIENGIDKTSIRDLQKVTGMSSSSIYYWFDNKYSLIVSAVEHGLEQVARDIFREAINCIDNFQAFVNRLPYIILDFKKQLRIVIQLSTSQQYRKALRDLSLTFSLFYDSFAEELAQKLKCNKIKVRALVYLVVSAVIHMVVFEDIEVAKMEFEFIGESFKEISQNCGND